jgi:hypothetical protein
MVGKSTLKLPVKCVSILCLLDLMLALDASRGTRNLVGRKLIKLLGFSLGLLTILMVLCITRTINLMLLDLNYVT